MPKLRGKKTGLPFSDAEVLTLARPNIQVLKPYVPGRSIEEVRAQYHPKAIVKLGSNENPLGANPKVVKTMAKVLKNVALYPDSSSRDLKQALAKHYGLKSENVMLGNGSDEVLLMLALAFIKPGERVIISENTFSEYEFSARMLDAEIIKVPLRQFRYDLSGFIKALSHNSKMIFLCNPNNPTGTYFTHSELKKLLDKTPRSCLVIVDEAYAEYATAIDFPRCIELQKHYSNLIITRTFSKMYGMAGLRLGYGLGDANLIRETQRVRTPFNVNFLVQSAALTALHDSRFVRRSMDVNVKGKAHLEKQLRKLKLEFLPTQANFICFKTPKPAILFCESLMRHGLITRPLNSFGLPNWCRVTIGTAKQNQAFLLELEKTMKIE